jgi:hypothetical protein
MDRTSDESQDGAAPEPLGGDFIIPVLACSLAGYYFVTTIDLTWEAKATGLFIGAVLAALSVGHLARLGLRIASHRGTLKLGELTSDTLFNRQRFGLLALVVLFIATIHWLGTTLGLFLVLVGCMLVMGVRNVRTLIGVAFTAAAVVYLLLIYLLSSRLPQGPIEKLLALVLGAG